MKKYVGKFILGIVDILTSLIFGVMPAMFGGMNIYAAIYTHGWTRFGNISVAILLLTLWVIFVYAFGNLEIERQGNKKIVEKLNTTKKHWSDCTPESYKKEENK